MSTIEAFNADLIAQRNLNTLVKLLQHRLNSVGKTKSTDPDGNIIEVDCDIFDQEALASFITLALSGFNQTPSFTSFTLDNDEFVRCFAEVLVEGATVYALSSQALLERGREASWVDAAGGVEFHPPSIAELLNTQYSQLIQIHQRKLELIKDRFKITDATGKSAGRHRYTTDKAHGKFPAGTECWATREADNSILFTYDDGTKFKLKGDWYLKGSEFPHFLPHKPKVSEEVVNDSSLPSALMFGAAMLGGLLATVAKGSNVKPVRVETTEPQPIEGEVDDSTDRIAQPVE